MTASSKMIELSVELSDEHADSLSVFLKRVSFSDFRANAKTDDEAYAMREACDKIAKALAEIGYRPR